MIFQIIVEGDPFEGHYFEGKKKGNKVILYEEDAKKLDCKEYLLEDVREIKWDGNKIIRE